MIARRLTVAVIENAVLGGGVSALGAALVSLGILKDSVIKYELAVKADDFFVMAQGTAGEIARAKAVLATTNPATLEAHHDAEVLRPVRALVSV